MESREKSVIRISVKREKAGKKESHLPCRRKNTEMRRAFAYLTTTRGINRTVLSEFIKRRMIYEDRKYHNAVFVGYDKSGVASCPQAWDIYRGKAFKGNEESSDPKYSFHWTGKSGRIYVFEAPIDLLSFLTLYQKEWEQRQLRGTLRIIGTGTVPDVGRCAVHQTGCIMPGQGQSGASGRRKNTKKSGRAGIPGGVPAFPSGKDWNEDLQELMAKGRRENLQMQ